MKDLKSGIEHLKQAKAHMSKANGIMSNCISKLKFLEEENAELRAKLAGRRASASISHFRSSGSKGGNGMSINKVIVAGNLTRDPELRETGNGLQILSFGVAVNDRRKNQQTGQWEDYANFVDCTMFGNRAASVARFLSKGAKVAIEGKLRWSQWQAKDGTSRSKLTVAVDEIEFLQRKEDGQRGMSAETAAAYRAMGVAPNQVAPAAPLYEDDVPF